MCKSILEICEAMDRTGSLGLDGTLATHGLEIVIVAARGRMFQLYIAHDTSTCVDICW
jgi:hypothetical protein